MSMVHPSLLSALAQSFLAGEAAAEQVVDRASRMLGKRWNWLTPLAKRYLIFFASQTRPRQRDVIRFLRHDSGLRRAWLKYRHELRVDDWLTDPQRMQPVESARNWNLPPIESPNALAKWLRLNVNELRWFADLKGLGYKKQRPLLRHYHYRILSKPSGGVRLIEAPKSRLKQIQRQILEQMLEPIPVHATSHGFVKGRSIKTFVAPHVGRRVVLRMDLQEYFPSFAGARIQSFFRTLGYPEAVADLLGGICTNATPRDVWTNAGFEKDSVHLHQLQSLYARPHLPQGAPTSPALANLCTYRADCRLSGLARSMNADYTRYADDLAFSSDDAQFERRIERFSTHVAAILMEGGFRVHFRKTRVMRQGVRQYLAGLVANQKLNVIRADFDRLKAILTNAIRTGPENQNREGHPSFRSHLEGRVGFIEMVNPKRGRHLRQLFERIQWGA